MRLLISVVIASVMFCACSVFRTEKEFQEFELSCVVTDLPSGTWLLLKNTITNEVDSALADNGRVDFKGALPDSISSAQFLLRTADWSDYRFMWLENSKQAFHADFKKFRNGQLSGSKAEADAERLRQIESAFQKQIDSLQIYINTTSTSSAVRAEAILKSHRLEDQRVIATQKFIADNPNSIVSGQLLDVYATAWGKDITSNLYELFSDDVKRSTYGKKVFQYITLSRDLKVGDYAVDFEQKNPDGKILKPSDFKGKILLLEFWASWCSPCRGANPALVNLYSRYHSRGFEILGVSWDEKESQWKKAIEDDKLLWPQVSELNGDRNAASLIYNVSAIPDNFLIDQNGMIIARNLNPVELEHTLQKLFESYPVASR